MFDHDKVRVSIKSDTKGEVFDTFSKNTRKEFKFKSEFGSRNIHKNKIETKDKDDRRRTCRSANR